ncbi:hypothetical protein GCM10027569_43570 [Flindersiella endophytica]
MRVLLSTYGSRGDVEPMVALAVALQAAGADVRVCAPPDEELVALLAGAGVPMVPYDRPWHTWERPSTPEEQARRASEFIDAQYDTLAAAAEGCAGVLATAMSIFVARTVAERAGIPHRFVAFAPIVVEDIGAQDWKAMFGEPVNAHRASIGLPELNDVADVGEFLFTDRPLLAADPTLGPLGETPGLDVAHAGAWILPDERPLPADLEAFLAAGEPPVYVGVREHAYHHRRDRSRGHRGGPRAGPPGVAGARLGRTGPSPTTGTTASPSARSTSRRCSAGWPPSYTTAAPERRRPRPGPALRRWSSRRPAATSRTGPAGSRSSASAPPTTAGADDRVVVRGARAGAGP